MTDTLPDEIRRWLHANGLTTGDIPIDAVPLVCDGRIMARAYLRDPDGCLMIERDALVAVDVTVPLTVAPPPALRPWLAGEVSPHDLYAPANEADTARSITRD